MSIYADKINQISNKISALIALKDQKTDKIESLLEENKALKEERFELANENLKLEKEIEKIKAFDSASPIKSDNLEEVKINGMIKEIEGCIALLKS